jgi:ribose transport system substrate-binding protein
MGTMFGRNSLLRVCATAALAAAAVVGCGRKAAPTGGASGRKTVYMVVKASESEFWQIVIDGARNAAEKLGAELVAHAPVSESEISKQISIFENAISAAPDALILAPSSSDPLVPAMERAMQEKLPLIVIDSAANTDQYTSFLASDNVKIGELSADCLAKALEARKGKAAGKIGALTFLSGASSLERRKSGFEKRIKEKYPDITIVDWRDAQGKSDASIGMAQDLMTRYPDLDGIFANNQNTGDALVRAIDMEERKGLAIVVVDAGAQEKWGLANGIVDYMIVQKPWGMGYMSVEYALKAAAGEKVEKFIDTGIVAITPEMLKSGEAEEFLDPVAFRKKQAK